MKKARLLSSMLVLCLVFTFFAQTAFASYKFTPTYGAQVWFTSDGLVNFELLTNDGQNHNLKIVMTTIKDGALVGENTVTKDTTTYFKVSASSANIDTALAIFYIDGVGVAYLSEIK